MGAEQTKLRCFPAFAPCALFYEGKSRDNVLGLTDLCYLDIDHIKEERLIEEAMDILRRDPYVMMASRSVSNEGLHILIRYQLKALETPPQRTTMSPDDMQGVYADVYYTPGHDESCLCYEVEENLFTGDAYIPGVKTVTTFPHSSKKKALESDFRISSMVRGMKVWPGHTIKK